jgi:L-threonylcarbamoyladenylate synthase
VSERFSCDDPEECERGIDAAVIAVARGGLVVLPTDTVYGIGADAFEPAAVARLLQAKGRGRDMPPPVLVSAATTLDALAAELPAAAHELVSAYWPGPLTLVCRQQASLHWDLGDTRGTVAVRMPDEEHALTLLARTGPLAVSSANRSGSAPATTIAEAEDMLGESVDVYLDAGESPRGQPSTIVDVTGDVPRVLRVGALDFDALRDVVPELRDAD